MVRWGKVARSRGEAVQEEKAGLSDLAWDDSTKKKKKAIFGFVECPLYSVTAFLYKTSLAPSLDQSSSSHELTQYMYVLFGFPFLCIMLSFISAMSQIYQITHAFP